MEKSLSDNRSKRDTEKKPLSSPEEHRAAFLPLLKRFFTFESALTCFIMNIL
jgi:hypothetical protein